MNNALTYAEPVYYGADLEKDLSPRSFRNPRITIEEPLIRTFPSPATEHFTVEYTILEKYENAVLMIVDLQGKIVARYTLTQAQDQKLIPVPPVVSGYYEAVILLDGKIYASTELILASRK